MTIQDNSDMHVQIARQKYSPYYERVQHHTRRIRIDISQPYAGRSIRGRTVVETIQKRKFRIWTAILEKYRRATEVVDQNEIWNFSAAILAEN